MIIQYCAPFFRFGLPSAIISLNQNDIDKIKEIILKSRLYSPYANPWNDNTADVVRDSKLIEVYKGQGEGDTKWKGCAWKLLLCMFNMIYFIKFKNA